MTVSLTLVNYKLISLPLMSFKKICLPPTSALLCNKLLPPAAGGLNLVTRIKLFVMTLTCPSATTKNNVEPSLYNLVSAKYLKYHSDRLGNPLFLKLLLNHVDATTFCNCITLIDNANSYKINCSDPGGEFQRHCSFLVYVSEYPFLNGAFVSDSVFQLLDHFQTCSSVKTFNVAFFKMKQ